MRVTLQEALKNYALPSTTFSFVGTTEEYCHVLNRKIAEILREKSNSIFVCSDSSSAFDNLTVYENIFVKKAFFLPHKRREQWRTGKALLAQFGVAIDLSTTLGDLSDEEKHIVELLRAVVMRPDVLLLSKSSVLVGYHYFDVFCDLLDYFKAQNTTVVLVTSRWEDTIRICEKVAVASRDSDEFTIIAVDEIQRNPHRLIYALSDYESEVMEHSPSDLLSSISTLFGYSEVLNQNKTLKESLEHLAGRIQEKFSASGCIIYLRDDRGKMLRYSDPARQQANCEIKYYFVNKLIDNTDGTLFVSRNKYDISSLFEKDEENIKTLVCYPITVSSQRTGLLQIDFDKYFLCTEEQIMEIKILCFEIAKVLLSAQAAYNSVLVQESNHRIKNNLQMIVSLIYLQKKHVRFNMSQHEKTADVSAQLYDGIVARVQTIAKVHEYLSEHVNSGDMIPFTYITDVVVRMYTMPEVVITTHIDDLYMDVGMALNMAMILNELISNCCKHAFDDSFHDRRTIAIRGTLIEKALRIIVNDNGKGLPEDFIFEDVISVGMTIVKKLVARMNGQIWFQQDDGTRVTVQVPLPAPCTMEGSGIQQKGADPCV